MAKFEITSLTIAGYEGEAVPNRFFRREPAAADLAVILPGLGYSADMPMLYYTAQVLRKHGSDVLQVTADYTRPEFQSAARPQQAAWLAGNAQAAVSAGLAQRSYRRLILAGKSIGTLALAHLLTLDLGLPVVAIWLTPLLHQGPLVAAALNFTGPALFVAGSGDDTFDPAALARIRQATRAEAILFEGANHSLEIPGDLPRSLRILQDLVAGIDAFMGRLGD